MVLTKIRKKQKQSAIITLILLAALLRLFLLSYNSFWFDEAYSANEAGKPIATLLAGTDPRHPPLYYAFLHYWNRFLGSTEWSLRLPSAMASLANLGLIYKLGKQLFNRDVALTAVLLLAVSPLDFWYAQEARSYMLVAFIGLAYATTLLWASPWRILPLTIILATGFYLDYTAVPLLIGITSIWFVYWWRQGRQPYLAATTLIALALAAICYIPWWPEFKLMLERLSGVHIFADFRQFLNLPYLSAQYYLIGLFLFAVTLTVFFNLLVHWLQKVDQTGRIGWIVAALFLFSLPVLVWPRLYTIKRVIVTVWPLLVLAVAWSIQQIQNKRQLVLWGLTAVSFLATFIMILIVPKDDWRGVAAYLKENSLPDTAVWVDPTWNEIALDYYEVDLAIHKGAIDEQGQLTESNLWLVAERLPSQTAPSSASEAWLNKNMVLVESIPFTRLELRLYQPVNQDDASLFKE